MPRKPIIQRTLTTTTVKCLCVDMDTKQTAEMSCTLARAYKTDKQIVGTINDLKLFGDNIKAVTVLEKSIEVEKYGMTEQEFLKHAVVETIKTN